MRKVLNIVAIMLFAVTANGQTTTGSISGSVVDSTGNVIAGAKVSIINPATNSIHTVTTNEQGMFTAPQLQPAQYTIIVEMTGFKKVEKTGIPLSAQDKLNAGAFTLEVGQVTDTVTVQADAGQLQLKTESGERSEVITNSQLRDLALNGRTTLDLIKILPGVSGEFGGSTSGTTGQLRNYNVNGTRINTKEFTIDGATNMDAGDNGAVHVTVNPDAIAEVKVLTSNFQAEFGKAGGAFISFVTKGGTNEFHAGARYFRRHDSMNANSFYNNANGRPRALYRYNNYGWDIGGPVWLPKLGIGDGAFWKGKDKLFFFFNQEYYDQFIPGGTATLRVPTMAERNGDFSQTVDGNGNKIYIKDPLKSGACNATVQAGCFPGNKIPSDRFYQYGQAILNFYPQPNFVGNNRYNYQLQASNDYPRREDNLRIDFNINQSHRLMGRLTNNSDKQSRPFGGTFRGSQNLPLTYVQQNSPGQNFATTLNSNLSATLVNEFGFGFSHGKIEIYPGNDNLTRSKTGIQIPQLFPGANPGDLIQDFILGGIANQTYPSTSYDIPFETNKYLFNFFDSITWVKGNHTFKGGIFVQRSENNNRPQVDHNGGINFANDVLNPLNAQHPYANALLGVFNLHNQANNYPKYKYVYNNIEWYLQDTFRFNRRLTLDYGLRMAHYTPQYNATGVGSAFNPDLYDPAKAMRLYVPVCVGVVTSCPTNNRRAVDPSQLVAGFTPTTANTLPSAYIGNLVPGSGDLTNGLGLEKNGYPRAGFETAAVVFAPRMGFAYTLTNDSKTVLRGGFGVSYDRMMGNISFGLGTNPPNIRPGTYSNGMLSDLGSAQAAPFSPAGVIGYSLDGKVPTIYSFSLGVQRDIGYGVVVDIAYVGTQGRHLSQRRNINAIPYLTTFQASAQDKTKFANGNVAAGETGLQKEYANAGFKYSGSLALPAAFLRPYQGYGAINYTEFVGTSNYNSLQASLNRRFSHGLTFGMAYTWSKAMSTGDADDTVTHPFDTRGYNYKLTDFDRTHVFVANYSWHAPAIGSKLSSSKFVRAGLDGWQLSGISRYQSGTPYQLTPTIAGTDLGIRVTGSPDLAPGFYLKSDPMAGKDGLLLDPNAFVLPKIGEIGPWPSRYLRRPAFWNHDLSLFKNFPLGGDQKRYLQLRLEAFNVFNQVQFVDVNGTTNVGVNYFTDYNSAVITPNLRTTTSTLPIGNFFGEPNGTGNREPRVIQIAAKIYF